MIKTTRAGSSYALRALPGQFGGPGLADYAHLDLPRILQVFLDLSGDVLGQPDGGQVIHIFGLDDDANLAAGLDGVGLQDTAERVADIFQGLDAANIGFEGFAPCPGAGFS